MPVASQTVRVFISSDFRDMHAERMVLEHVVFPELRRRCKSLGVELIKIDPCCDVTEEQAQGEGAIARRLQLAEQCRPYLIGLLGERYGKIPATLPQECVTRHPWLTACRGLSLAELEILLVSRNLAASAQRTFFYLRDPRFLNKVPPERRGDYLSTSAEYGQKQRALKARLPKSGRPLLADYPCRWNAETGQVAGLEGFADGVINDLWVVLCADYPPKTDVLPEAPPSQFRQVAPTPGSPPRTRALPSEPASVPPPSGLPATRVDLPAAKTPYIHDNVQFTVYRPKVVEPSKWYDMLAFAHLDELPEDAGPDEPDPVEEVKRQARQILGADIGSYKESTRGSRAAVPREGEITFLPEMQGVQFNPPRRTFLWTENVHREEFRLRANPVLTGENARGTLAVFLGSILLAEIPLSIRVQSGLPRQADSLPQDRNSARPYRKIFASYSHRDMVIVEEFERYGRALGDTYLRDLVHLRAGEAWNDQLRHMIQAADVFQLFWSRNAMTSPFVEQEWRFALSLRRPNFIRPTYWEDPLPEMMERGLPPEELTRLHFHRLTLNLGAPPTHPPVGMPVAPEIMEAGPTTPAPAPIAEELPLAYEADIAEPGDTVMLPPPAEAANEVTMCEEDYPSEAEMDSASSVTLAPGAIPPPTAVPQASREPKVASAPVPEAIRPAARAARARSRPRKSKTPALVVAIVLGVLALAATALFLVFRGR